MSSGPGVDDKNVIYIFDLSKNMLRNVTSSPDDENTIGSNNLLAKVNRVTLAETRKDQQ